MKRGSPDTAFVPPAPAASKRQKLQDEPEKENRFRSDAKGKGREVPIFDAGGGFAVAKPRYVTPAPSSKLAIADVPSLSQTSRTPAPFASVSGRDHSDLQFKSVAELRTLYAYNDDECAEARKRQRNHTLGIDTGKDLFTLQEYIRLLDDRNEAIRAELTARENPGLSPRKQNVFAAESSGAATRSSSNWEDGHSSYRASTPPTDDSFFADHYDSAAAPKQTSNPPATNNREDRAASEDTFKTRYEPMPPDDAELWDRFSEPGIVVPDDDGDFSSGVAFVESPPDVEIEEVTSHAVASTSRAPPTAPALPPPPPIDVPKYDGALERSAYYLEAKQKLSTTFGLQEFRKNQLDAIIGTLSGRDVLVLMPTGGGKSLCYQLPALCTSGRTHGVSFIVSPLIALMEDQVQQLRSKDVDADLFTSERDFSDRSKLRNRLFSAGDKPNIVYITPERLSGSPEMSRILEYLYQRSEIARFVIDEAHLISSWGRDFRDSYVALRTLREKFPNIPIMALTATATEEERRDIVTGLGMRDHLFLTQSFNRANLRYTVVKKPQRTVDYISRFIQERHPGATGIVYCGGRDKCETVARQLRDLGVEAKHFHAEMSPTDKAKAMSTWKEGSCKVIVATIAFGMGIDKPDVRFVIHHDMPSSLAGYNQETGRAGRDGKPSDCLLLYSFKDFGWQRDRIMKDDTLSHENRARLNRALEAMDHFSTNTTDCRRAQLLSIYSERFDPRDCGGSCDNCKSTDGVVEEDVSATAADLVALVRSAEAHGMKITKPMCVETYRGSKRKDLVEKQVDRLQGFGAGKGQDKGRIDRTVQRLLDDNVFEPVVLSAGASAVAREQQRLAPATVEGARRVSTGGAAPPEAEAADPHVLCYADLSALRAETATKEGLEEEDVLAMETLELLSVMLPEDKAGFENVVNMSPDSGSEDDKWKDYGAAFLNVCTKYAMFRSEASRYIFTTTMDYDISMLM
ncbi:hypothetical protein EWM64_g2122 [Hericium alpestre]|uniref:ATP-dependent DNA helicase n=1 Tax=Hericium alpestre TaxID=135208 RepID=A0A4Z0A6B3_9AGAM|nr:hypothetical protein EWM64_g2122 [Hericium alpestre]